MENEQKNAPDATEKLVKWRLILGKNAEPKSDSTDDADAENGQNTSAKPHLTDVQTAMDNALEALYGDRERRGGLGGANPSVNRWLGDIRRYFGAPMVQVMQRDALVRLDLQRLLLEPELLELLEPDVHLVTTLLALKDALPDQTRETARAVVRKVVEDLEKKLAQPLREAVRGALSRSVRNRRPRLNEMDWQRTIHANLKNYQPSLKTIIPENFIGRGRRGQALRHVILLVDESGSMAQSVVYAALFGAVMASLSSLRTQMVAFSTEIVDLTEHLREPIDLLFGAQLGGGTDISKALAYTEGLISSPSDTILLLISDLFEGGKSSEMLRRAATLRQSGVTFVCLLALSDEGKPAFDKENAARFAALDIPTFACTPDRFPELMAAAISKKNLFDLFPA